MSEIISLRCFFVTAFLLPVSCSSNNFIGFETSSTRNDIILDRDHRIDAYLHPDGALRSLALRSTAAVVKPSSIDLSDPENVTPATLDSIGIQFNLCRDQAFFDDSYLAQCSGTLIDHDLILTSYNCLEVSGGCDEAHFVFNYYKRADNAVQRLTARDVFRCKQVEVLANSFVTHPDRVGSHNYAIVRLDRSTSPRFEPAAVRRSAQPVSIGQEIAIIGYPVGTPVKIASNGFVQRSSENRDFFTANVDSFAASSGSGYYQVGDYELAGVHFGTTSSHFDSVDGCLVARQVCPDCAESFASYVYPAIQELCEQTTSLRLCNTVSGYVFGLEADGTVYHYVGDQTANTVYLCVNGLCEPASRHGDRWEIEDCCYFWQDIRLRSQDSG